MSAEEAPALNGILLVNKPRGLASKRISTVLSKILPKGRIGHLGTLDPLADGLLPILLGKATRLQDYLITLKKAYRCQVKLGYETDTLDLEGQIQQTKPIAPFTASELVERVHLLLGASSQLPPIYSAVKFQGKALYKYARNGQGDQISFERLARPIFIYEAKSLGCNEDSFSFEVVCSKGTYIRVLAQRLALELANLGTVTTLTRTQCAGFGLERSVSLEDIQHTGFLQSDAFKKAFVPIEELEIGLPKVQVVNDRLCKNLMMGQSIQSQLGVEGDLRGLENIKDDSISPERILIFDANRKALALGTISPADNGHFAISITRSLR